MTVDSNSTISACTFGQPIFTSHFTSNQQGAFLAYNHCFVQKLKALICYNQAFRIKIRMNVLSLILDCV